MKKASRAEQMAQVLRAQASSGLNKKDFCKAEGISRSLFFYWQRRLSKMSSVSKEESGFTQVSVFAASELELRLPSGTWIGVRSNSTGELGLLLAAIDEAYA